MIFYINKNFKNYLNIFISPKINKMNYETVKVHPQTQQQQQQQPTVAATPIYHNIKANDVLVNNVVDIVPKDHGTIVIFTIMAVLINVILPGIGTCLCGFMTLNKLYNRAFLIAGIQFTLILLGALLSTIGVGLLILPIAWLWAIIYPIYLASYLNNLSK